MRGFRLNTMPTREALERAVIGALRSAIKDHGPITPDKITSAAKRVLGNLANVGQAGIQPPSAASLIWAGATLNDQRTLLTKARGLLKQALGELENQPQYAVSLRADIRAELAKLDEALKADPQ